MSLFPNYILQFFDNNGDPLSGGKLFFYEPGGTTKKDTTDGSGGAVNPNPIILDSAGRPDNSGTPIDIYLIDGETYKIVIAPSTDSDPPVNPIRTTNNLVDLTGSGQWVNTKTPTYANATQFTLVGNQTADYTVGRRVKTIGGADRYSRISISSYAAPTTTITVVDTRDSSGGAQSLHASMTSASTHLITPDGLRGAMLIEGIADATGTVDAITATFYPAIALSDKVAVMVRASGANTITTPTFAPDGVTAKTIVKNNNAALGAGDIAGADHVLILQYNSTNDNWNLLNAIAVANQATEEARGSAEIATQAEVDAEIDDLRFITPLKLGNWPITNDPGTIGQTEIGNSAVGQGELKTAASDVGTSATSYASLTMAGGSYSFWPRVSIDGGGGIRVWARVAESVSSTSDVTNISLKSNSGSYAAHAHSIYVMACPPYLPFAGNGQVYQFLYVAINKSTSIVEMASSAVDPVWANNGPTIVNPLGKLKRLANLPGCFLDCCGDPVKLNEYINNLANVREAVAELTPKEINQIMFAPMSQEEKNRDMDLIPHPFPDADPNKYEIALIDPCGLFNETLHNIHLFSGDYLSHIALGQYLIIDNTPQKIQTPNGLKAYGARFK